MLGASGNLSPACQGNEVVNGQIVPARAGLRAADGHNGPASGNRLPASGGIGAVSGGRWTADVVSGVVRRVIRAVREGIGVVSVRSGSGSWPGLTHASMAGSDCRAAAAPPAKSGWNDPGIVG